MKCSAGCYCPEFCRASHEPTHAKVCDAIQQLTALEIQKMVFSVREKGQVKVKNKLKFELSIQLCNVF